MCRRAGGTHTGHRLATLLRGRCGCLDASVLAFARPVAVVPRHTFRMWGYMCLRSAERGMHAERHPGAAPCGSCPNLLVIILATSSRKCVRQCDIQGDGWLPRLTCIVQTCGDTSLRSTMPQVRLFKAEPGCRHALGSATPDSTLTQSTWTIEPARTRTVRTGPAPCRRW